MSDSLQFGHHPDADQISAFVEQALPAHEREMMLGHLAVCSECRAVVALSLPELEVPALAVAAPVRMPWWRGWPLALPLAGALAASILTFVYLYPNTRTPIAREPQVADVHPAQQLAVPEQLTRPQPPVSPAPARRALSESRTSPPIRAAAAAPAPASQALAFGQAAGGPLANGRNIATLHMESAAPATGAEPDATPATNTAPVRRSSGAGNLVLSQAAPLAPPVLNAAPAATNANQTVAVQSFNNALNIDTASVDLSNQAIPRSAMEAIQPGRPLPSRLGVVSSATLGKRIVAIDSAHNVFASKDAGKHWKPVLTLWQGRPIQASLAQLPRGAAVAGLSTIGLAARPVAQPSAVQASSLSGTVTDRTGAVIPGTSVIATEIATGAAHAARTDATGHYLLNGLAPGHYKLEAQSPGFRKQELANVAVQPTGTTTANLTLDVAESTQTVTVQADSVTLNPQALKQTQSQSPAEIAPLFQIVTDSGDRWTSADGLHWNHN